MRRALILSLLIHLALIFIFRGGTPSQQPVEKVEVIYLPPAATPHQPRGKATSKQYYDNKKLNLLKSRRLSTGRPLNLGLSTRGRKSNRPTAESAGENGGWSDEDWGVRGGDFGEISNYLPYERIQEQVRAALHYPSVLGRRGIEGTVNVRLAFKAGTGCDWKRSRVSSTRRPLAIYVVALLKDICRLEIARGQALAKAGFVDFSFMFSLSNGAHSQEAEEARDFIVGNVLSFRRTFPESLVQYHLGPLTGVWFLPVVSLDWPWILEKWDHYVNGVDAMAPFRD